MRFEGVLFIVGKPSKVPPRGSRGHNVILLPSAIEDALRDLPGKELDSSECLSTHNRNNKIGRIERAFIVGDMFCIAGECYNRGDNIIQLQASGERLGLSYDILNGHVDDMRNLIYRVSRATFIGAAVLKQSKAAHRGDCLFWLV